MIYLLMMKLNGYPSSGWGPNKTFPGLGENLTSDPWPTRLFSLSLITGVFSYVVFTCSFQAQDPKEGKASGSVEHKKSAEEEKEETEKEDESEGDKTTDQIIEVVVLFIYYSSTFLHSTVLLQCCGHCCGSESGSGSTGSTCFWASRIRIQ